CGGFVGISQVASAPWREVLPRRPPARRILDHRGYDVRGLRVMLLTNYGGRPRRRPRGNGRSQSRRRRWAIAAASTRVWTSSLARMLETWTLAVLGLMNKAWAIWRLLRPDATRASTSHSRRVRPSCAAGGAPAAGVASC